MKKKNIAIALLTTLSAGMVLAGCGGPPGLDDLAKMAEQYQSQAAQDIEKAKEGLDKATSSLNSGTGTALPSSSSDTSSWAFETPGDHTASTIERNSSEVSGSASSGSTASGPTVASTALVGTCWTVTEVTENGKTISIAEYAKQNNMPGHISTIEFSETEAVFCDYENGKREESTKLNYSLASNGKLNFNSPKASNASVSGNQMKLSVQGIELTLVKGDFPAQTAPSGSSSTSSGNSGSKSGSESQSSSSKSSSGSQSSSSKKADQSNYYVLPGSDYMYVGNDVLSKMNNWELCIARNEIFARRGRRFKVKEIQAYFDSQAWYNGTIDPSNFSSSVFNPCESANIDRILDVEKARNSPYVDIPGDHISGGVPEMPGSYSLS